MTDALRDAEILARALAAMHAGAGEAEALSAYHATRNALSVPMLELTDQIASLQWTDAQIQNLLLRMSKLVKEEAAPLGELDETQLLHKGDPDESDQWLEQDAARHAA
jgi:2-polyprenyl-6-methoxyphenol hydroxylase-like FAD-dependent oxidoreductase